MVRTAAEIDQKYDSVTPDGSCITFEIEINTNKTKESKYKIKFYSEANCENQTNLLQPV